MGKKLKSEVTVICGNFKSTIPLHLLINQSVQFSILTPPIDNIYFSDVSEDVMHDFLYFSRLDCIREPEKNLEKHIIFAENWNLDKFLIYLKQTKEELPPVGLEFADHFSVQNLDYTYYTAIEYIKDAKIFNSGIRIMPQNIVVPTQNITFKIQLVNSFNKRIAFKITSSNKELLTISNKHGLILPLGTVMAPITRSDCRYRSQDQLVFHFADASNVISPKACFKDNYPVTEIIVNVKSI